MAKKKPTGPAGKTKPAAKKHVASGPDEVMCCNCDIGGMVSPMTVSQCQQMGGTCRGPQYPCPGKDKDKGKGKPAAPAKKKTGKK